ncbi:hypothetical protein [Kingella denitrificans]|uniref:hypothetical protein n=1 Tax=Kingella denitrificans TaxID=502 RepID=UPI0011D175ED|nr:hypothetical protein [Kingella denitrificans]
MFNKEGIKVSFYKQLCVEQHNIVAIHLVLFHAVLRRLLPYWVAVGVPPDGNFIICCFLMKFKNMPIFVSAIFGHFGGWTDVFCRILLDYFCLNMVQKQPAHYI